MTSNIEIRKATREDIPEIAAIHVAGWQAAYGGLIDQDYIESQNLEKRLDDWNGWFEDEDSHFGVAVREDKIIGFIAYGSLRTAPPGTSKIRPLYSSEIYGLYLAPEVFRQGIGTALIKESVAQLKQKKHQSMCLWVLDKNKRGCAFYEKMGGQRIGKKMVEFGPTKAKEVCYGWRDIEEILNR